MVFTFFLVTFITFFSEQILNALKKRDQIHWSASFLKPQVIQKKCTECQVMRGVSPLQADSLAEEKQNHKKKTHYLVSNDLNLASILHLVNGKW